MKNESITLGKNIRGSFRYFLDPIESNHEYSEKESESNDIVVGIQLENNEIYSYLKDLLDSKTSAFLEDQEYFEVITEKEQLRRQYKDVKDHLTILYRQKFRNNLILKIKNAIFEYGFKNEVDEFMSEMLSNYGAFSKQWLEELFLEKFDSPDILCGILRTIGNFDYDTMCPHGMTMASASFSHQNLEVIECGIRCFENWENPEALKILYNLSISEEWLNNYLKDVINCLEEIRELAAAS